ncbi:hypothetical protein B296_00010247 [Ensete ventricosum]|uniref:Uncharacterized protein n=1 Tax=Ensete ventricosum TaxID=4639 RepID=A0A426ZUQ5_ENSVE|nr:hypothetical protein B296_00010247 [Ensete ventricosum]
MRLTSRIPAIRKSNGRHMVRRRRRERSRRPTDAQPSPSFIPMVRQPLSPTAPALSLRPQMHPRCIKMFETEWNENWRQLSNKKNEEKEGEWHSSVTSTSESSFRVSSDVYMILKGLPPGYMSLLDIHGLLKWLTFHVTFGNWSNSDCYRSVQVVDVAILNSAIANPFFGVL